MEQIRYRAWDKELKRYRHDAFLKSGDGEADWIVFLEEGLSAEPKSVVFSRDSFYSRSRFELEVYLGLEDKNGHPIYQNDIVLFKFTDEEDPKENDHGIAAVAWDQDNFQFVLISEDNFSTFWKDEKMWDFEVIGTANETPQLLKPQPQKR